MKSTLLNPDELQKIQPKGFPGLPSDWMTEGETHLSSDQKVQIFQMLHREKEWKNPRALVVFHGVGEHGGRYLHFPHYIKSDFGAVLCPDHRGHGRSTGVRGHVDAFDQYADDAVLAIEQFYEKLKKKFSKPEIHVFGHSLGGLISLRALYRRKDLPIVSFSTSAPAFKLREKVPGYKHYPAYLLNLLWPSLQLPSGINPDHVCSDPAVVKAYVEDRLVHNKATPRFYLDYLSVAREVFETKESFPYPALFCVPLGDQLIESEQALDFFERFQAKEKKLVTYAEMGHEVFNEVGKEKAFGELLSWVRAHSSLS